MTGSISFVFFYIFCSYDFELKHMDYKNVKVMEKKNKAKQKHLRGINQSRVTSLLGRRCIKLEEHSNKAILNFTLLISFWQYSGTRILYMLKVN